MPELPEVENVKRDLAIALKHNPKINQILFNTVRLRTKLDAKINSIVCGMKIWSLIRRAKYILFEVDNGFLLSHLGMSGSWRVQGSNGDKLKHDHILIKLSDGNMLVYHDPRRFGVFEWLPNKVSMSSKWLIHLGPEPFDASEFNTEYLHKKLSVKKNAIKSALLDQKLVAGLGNIYVNEALFLSNISPLRKSFRVTKFESEILVKNIRLVLQKAIDSGGSTIRDYRRGNGNTGNFQNQFKVYGRHGLLCLSCKSKIKSKVIAGRSSFWCPKCQK